MISVFWKAQSLTRKEKSANIDMVLMVCGARRLSGKRIQQ